MTFGEVDELSSRLANALIDSACRRARASGCC